MFWKIIHSVTLANPWKCAFSAVQKLGRLVAFCKAAQVVFNCVTAAPVPPPIVGVHSQPKVLVPEEHVLSEQQAVEH